MLIVPQLFDSAMMPLQKKMLYADLAAADVVQVVTTKHLEWTLA